MLASPRLSAATRRLALAGLLVLSASSARADTIIKLGLGGDAAADLELSGGILSTVDDGDGATTGNQNTNIEFLGFLSFLTDETLSLASYTLDGVAVAGPATVFGGSMAIQNLTGGTLSLYDGNNILLLSASLVSSVITGPVGAPATGAIFSTSFATLIPGGTLDAYLDPNSISFSISMSDVNGGTGLSVSGGGTVLDPFTADATQTIAAEVPEPKAAALLGLGAALVALLATPARRRSARCTVRGSSAARRR